MSILLVWKIQLQLAICLWFYNICCCFTKNKITQQKFRILIMSFALGAHINPAVTIACFFTRLITPLRTTMYILAQLGGSIAGAALLYGWVVQTWEIQEIFLFLRLTSSTASLSRLNFFRIIFSCISSKTFKLVPHTYDTYIRMEENRFVEDWEEKKY